MFVTVLTVEEILTGRTEKRKQFSMMSTKKEWSQIHQWSCLVGEKDM